MRRSGSRVCIHLYPPAIVLPPGDQRAYLELFAPGQDGFLASIVYIVGSHIVQGFVITALVVVVNEVGDRCPEAIRSVAVWTLLSPSLAVRVIRAGPRKLSSADTLRLVPLRTATLRRTLSHSAVSRTAFGATSYSAV